LRTWFRVELDASGAILSCRPADKAEANGKSVRYIEALTAAEACSEAKAWHRQRIATQERCRKAKAEARKAAGCCARCDAPPVRAGLCKRHHEMKTANVKASREGRAVPRAPLTAEQARAAYARDHIRASLPRVLEQFDKLGPEAFRAWLVAEINRRSAPEKQAK